jgi:hypothetical protein
LEKITQEKISRFVMEQKIELFSTHSNLCLPIIDRIYRKMLMGIKFSAIKVVDGLICDGHHRYLASLLAQFNIERIPTIISSATKAVDWKSVTFAEEDWDTQAKIDMLNAQDALYNNVDIQEIIEMLK